MEDISRDGKQMLLCRFVDESDACELWAAPVEGGSARRLGDLVLQDGCSAWSPDGEELVYTKGREIRLAYSNGKTIRSLATLPGDRHFPRWSPDGRVVRFTVLAGHLASLWEARMDGSGASPLLRGWDGASSPCCGSWTPDGKYFVFQATNKGVDSVWALREKAGLLQLGQRSPLALTHGPQGAIWPLVSADGKRLFVGGPPTRNEFLRYELKSRQLIPAFRGLSGTEREFSRDGSWIVYVSEPDQVLWRSAIDGSQRLQLTQAPGQAHVPAWSPDGKQIAFAGGPEVGPARIYVVSRDGGDLKRATKGESGEEGDWDPPGHRTGASLPSVACQKETVLAYFAWWTPRRVVSPS